MNTASAYMKRLANSMHQICIYRGLRLSRACHINCHKDGGYKGRRFRFLILDWSEVYRERYSSERWTIVVSRGTNAITDKRSRVTIIK